MSKIIWSKEFSYFLGYLWSDSYIDKYRTILEIIEDDAISIEDSLNKIEFLKINKNKRHRKDRKPQMSFTICDIKFYNEFMVKYDYHVKSNSSPIKIISDIPKELVRYFYLGLFDGDGCFYISKDKKVKQVYMSSNYNQDWKYMIDFYNLLDIEMYEVRRTIAKNGNKSAVIRIKKYSEIEKLYNYLYPSGYEIGLKRKYEKCLDIINNKPSQNLNTKPIDVEFLTKLINEKKTIYEIANILACGWRKIYDFCKKHNIKYNKGFFNKDLCL